MNDISTTSKVLEAGFKEGVQTGASGDSPTSKEAGAPGVQTGTQVPQAAPAAKQPGSPAAAGTRALGPAAPSQSGAGFTIQFQRGDLPWLKELIYGDYGSGKTWLAGTSADVPDMRDVLLISAESGELTLRDPDHSFHLIDPIKVTSFRTLARIYDFLKAHCRWRDDPNIEVADEKLRILQAMVTVQGEPGSLESSEPSRLRRYRTVIVDSLTEVEVYCMQQLLGITDTTAMDEETQGAEWAEYKKQHQMVQRMIRNFRDLPMHVLFTAARAYTQDELKRHIYAPMMTGKLSSQVQGFMDVVGYLVTGTAADDQTALPRRLYVQPGSRFAAKSRFSTYRGAYFDNPTMGTILLQVGLLKAVPKA
jgi:hypothetical protein